MFGAKERKGKAEAKIFAFFAPLRATKGEFIFISRMAFNLHKAQPSRPYRQVFQQLADLFAHRIIN